MNIYLAASSDQVERAKYWTAKLRLAGFNVVSTWIERIAEHGGVSNPRTEDQEGERRGASYQNLTDIDKASVLWFLVPTNLNGNVADTPHGRGGYWESGYAKKAGKHLVFSGDTKQSSFCSLGAEFVEDLDAFAAIVAYARREGL